MSRKDTKTRPETFTLNRQHPLHRGLVFAGLGAHAGSTRYYDSSVFGNTGTLTNMEVEDWKPATIGRTALDFGGTNEYVAGAAGVLPSQMSISVWWKSAGDYTTNQALIGFAAADSSSSGVITFAYTDNKVQWWNAGSGPGITSDLSISTDEWRHIAVTRTSANSATLYINGVSQATPSVGTPQGGSQSMGVGRFGGYSGYYLIGQVADPLVYTRILSLPEIQQLADPSNVMLSGLIQPPRRKWWPVAGGAPAETVWGSVFNSNVIAAA